MTNEEAIKMFKAIIMAEIDRLPYHYDAEVGEDVYDSTSKVNKLLQLNKIICEALERQMHSCKDCQHGDRFDSYYPIYCYKHNAIIGDDNCCRDWSDEDCCRYWIDEDEDDE